MESIGWDRLLFASDYPHWDFDDPFRAFPAGMPRDRYKQILTANARSVYRLGLTPWALFARNLARGDVW